MVREKRDATPGLTDEEALHLGGVARRRSPRPPPGGPPSASPACRWPRLPKSRPESSGDSAYASSMNSTPPRARSKASWVRIAVEPMCSPTRSTRETSTRWPRSSTPSEARISPYSRATVVLPVPGEPVKTRWRRTEAALSPASWRRRPTSIMSVSARTSRLTLSRPTSASSSPRTAFDGARRLRGSAAAPSAGSAARWPGTAPSSPGGLGRASARRGAGAAGGRRSAALVAGAVLDDAARRSCSPRRPALLGELVAAARAPLRTAAASASYGSRRSHGSRSRRCP